MANQLLLDSNNTSYSYRYYTKFSDGNFFDQGWRMTYNGNPVVYLPKEYAEKGVFKNDTQYLQNNFLNSQLWPYMKPASVSANVFKNPEVAKGLTDTFKNPYDGYIIDENKFKEFKLNSSVSATPRWDALGKPNPPVSGIGEDKGKLVYVGKSGDDRNGELVVYDNTGASNLYVHTGESSFWGDVGRALGKLGPATLLLNSVAPGLGTAMYVGTNVGQGIATGNWGKAALNIALASLPGAEGVSAAKGTIFEIPAVANSVKTISDTLGVSAGMAGAIVNGAVNLMANGGSLTDALKTTLAQELGQGAAQYASQLAGLQGMKGLDTVLKTVTKNSTAALLLNQDVAKVAKESFANAAVPMALQSTLGWNSLSKTQQSALSNAALSAVKGGKMDVVSAIRGYTSQVFAHSALNQIGGNLTESQKQLARRTIMAGIEGKPLDSALQSYMIGEARTAISNQVAQAEGWENDAQKQAALKQYGSKIKPQEYIAKQQSWEDLAERQAAIAKYGSDITPIEARARDAGWDSYDQKQAAQQQYGPSISPDDYSARQRGWEDLEELKAAREKYQTANITPIEARARDEGWQNAAQKYSVTEKYGQVGAQSGKELLAIQDQLAQANKNVLYNKTLVSGLENTLKTRTPGTAQYRDTASKLQAAKDALAKEQQSIADAQQRMSSILNPPATTPKPPGDQLKLETPKPETAGADQQITEQDISMQGGSGVFDQSGREYTKWEFARLPENSVVYDEAGKPTRLGSMGLEIAGTQESQLAAIAQLGKTDTQQLAPGPLTAMFGGQEGGGAKTGTGFSLIGKTGAGESVYSKEGTDFSVVLLPGSNQGRLIDKKTQQVYLLTPEQTQAVTQSQPTEKKVEGQIAQPTPTPTPTPLKTEQPIPQTPTPAAVVAPESVAPAPAPSAPKTEVATPTPTPLETSGGQPVTPAPTPWTPTPETPTTPSAPSPTDATKALEALAASTGIQIGDLRTEFQKQFEAARLAGASSDQALQAAIAAVGEQAAAAQAQTREQMAASQQETAQKFGDIESRIAQLQQQGMSQAEATSKALAELTAGQTGLGQQVSQQQQQTQQQFSDVNARIAQLQQQGLSQAEATNRALAELTAGQAGLGQQLGSVQTGMADALKALQAQFGATTTGLQQQLGQAQQQAQMGNLIAILGLGKQSQPSTPLPLVGEIKPYEFSTDLLAGVYGNKPTDIYNANNQLIDFFRS